MALVADLTHFLNEDGQVPDLPDPAKKLLMFLVAIVTGVSSDHEASIVDIDIKCCERDENLICDGYIEAWCNCEQIIVWACNTCAENGTIANWQKSIWDSRMKSFH